MEDVPVCNNDVHADDDAEVDIENSTCSITHTDGDNVNCSTTRDQCSQVNPSQKSIGMDTYLFCFFCIFFNIFASLQNPKTSTKLFSFVI